MDMSSHHTTQEGDGLCVPEMNVSRSGMQINPSLKAEDFVRIIAEAEAGRVFHSPVTPPESLTTTLQLPVPLLVLFAFQV